MGIDTITMPWLLQEARAAVLAAPSRPPPYIPPPPLRLGIVHIEVLSSLLSKIKKITSTQPISRTCLMESWLGVNRD